MSTASLPIPSDTSTTASSPTTTERASPVKAQDASREVKEASAAFEAILVRQMLTSASVAGKGSYSDMGVEAVASAVTAGGGLGLGRAIQQALGHSHPNLAEHPFAHNSTSPTGASPEAKIDAGER